MAANQNYNFLPLIHVFRTVIEKGSFQAAANSLSLPRSSVSKKVQQLEEVLGQPLITRSTRKLIITDFGQEIMNESDTISHVLNNVETLIQRNKQVPQGKVKISSSALMGELKILPLIPLMRSRYPQIQLDISFSDSIVDLVAEGVDIALRIGPLPNSSLVAKRIATKYWGWFASPDYLSRAGTPLSPSDLEQHQCLVFGNAHNVFAYWAFEDSNGMVHGIQIKPAVITDNSRALLNMANSGSGIVMLDPDVIRKELSHGELVPVLTDYKHPDVSPVNLVSLGPKQRSLAAETIWRFLVEQLSNE